MIIWLASYPRSGNTFLRILLNIAFGVKSSSLYKAKVPADLVPIIGHIELSNQTDLAQLSTDPYLSFIKTHERPHDDNRAIYVIRDGRAALNSYYFFLRDILRIDVGLRELIAGTKGVGSWSEHIEDWHPLDRPGTHVLRFEEMTSKPESVIEGLSQFLGREPLTTHVPKFDDLHALAPAFFREGLNESWMKTFTHEDVELFWSLHGRTMDRYGYIK